MGHELVSLLIPVLYRYDTRTIPRPELSQNKIISSLYFPPSRVYHYLKLPECLWPLYVYNPFEERHNTLILYSPVLPEFLNSLSFSRFFVDGVLGMVCGIINNTSSVICMFNILYSIQHLQLLVSSKPKKVKAFLKRFPPPGRSRTSSLLRSRVGFSLLVAVADLP